MKAKVWVIGKKFEGEPTDENLVLKEEELPELGTGDVLLEAEWWSVDPYMRPSANRLPVGSTMVGSHIAKVIKTKNGKYPLGSRLVSYMGWRSHTVCNPDTVPMREYAKTKSPVISWLFDTGALPKSLGLGVLGMPGATAYFGFLEICQPKAGETVLVNGAAGAVGSLVGQIAKIKGCKVIGFAGTDEKVKYIRDDLGFDFAFNYKKIDVSDALKGAAPEGIDCYFDNVGGEFTTKVLVHHMNIFGRVSICGSISRYNDDPLNPKPAPELYPIILGKQLKIEGFIVSRWAKQFPDCFVQMRKWIEEGKLKYKEHVTMGFVNMRSAFYGMLKGQNTGKAIIKAT